MKIDDIRKAQPADEIWDDEVKGLHLRVSATNKKSFLLYYRTKAKIQRRPKLGDFPDITLAEARKRAKEILKAVAIGEDPKASWDKSKEELTVNELFKVMIEKYWGADRFKESARLRDVISLYNNHIKNRFGAYKLSTVTVLEVKTWHEGKTATPIAANRALEVFSRMFTYAEERGLLPQHTNPCRLVSANRERKRKRFATPDELKGICTLLDREYESNPVEVTFLYLLMLTGSRPKAIERGRKDQLQRFEKDGISYAVLTFNGKTTEATGEEEVVIIPPQGLELLDRLPVTSSEFLIDCKMPRNLWEKIREEVGCPDLWARDLRRTFSTVGLSHGVSIGAISEVLNHKSTQTTKIYAKLMDTERVNAVTTIADKINSLAGMDVNSFNSK